MHKATHHKLNGSRKAYHAAIRNIRTGIRGTSNNVKYQVEKALYDSLDNVKGKSRRLRKNVTSYTAHKPLQSLGIALTTGLLVGYLLKSKSKKERTK